MPARTPLFNGPYANRIQEAVLHAEEARSTLSFHRIYLRVYDHGATWRFFADGIKIAKFQPAAQQLWLLSRKRTTMTPERCLSVPAVVRRVVSRARRLRAARGER